MGLENERETERALEIAAPSRRHRTVRLAIGGEPRGPATHGHSTPHGSIGVIGGLTDELRASLWEVVNTSLFAPLPNDLDRWTNGVTGRPSVRRVWSAAPISGSAERIPEEVADVLESWFMLVEPADVFAFLETVHDNVDAPSQQRFITACNAALERGVSDHRFVLRRLTPIASKVDIATIERALTASKKANIQGAETHLLDALERLARKPDPDARGAIQEAIRAVLAMALPLTGERHLSLEETMEELEARGHVDGALKGAYGGLFAYVGSSTRRTTTDDARLIVVTCAGFVSHLAAKIG